MLKSVLTLILSALLLPGMPSVSWKSEIRPAEEGQYQLVVTGTIAPDYYVHPMADEFVGTLTANTIAASTDEQANYALNGVAFVIVRNPLSVAANKCWLVTGSTVQARSLKIVFSDETTGISEKGIVNSEKFAPATKYDLQGRRVQKTTKGIYIINGKKVIVK